MAARMGFAVSVLLIAASHVLGKSIYQYDLTTGETTLVSDNAPDGMAATAISGDIVTWFEGGSIYAKNVKLGTGPVLITTTAETAGQVAPAIDGDIIVWSDRRAGGQDSDIYGYRLSTGKEFPVCINSAGYQTQYRPSISGNIVVWNDGRGGTTDVWGKNLTTDEEFPVSVRPSAEYWPDMCGNMVVWVSKGQGTHGPINEIWARDLSDPDGIPYLLYHSDTVVFRAVVGDGLVAWQELMGAERDIDIRALDLESGQILDITTEPGNQKYPSITGRRIVWEDLANGAISDLYGVDILPSHGYANPIAASTTVLEDRYFIAAGRSSSLFPEVDGNTVIWQDFAIGTGAIPEPGSVIMGAAFLGVGWYARRRRMT